MFDIRDGEGTIRLIGRLDAAESEGALSRLNRIDRSVTADCRELDYISSAGLGVIMETWKRLHALGSTLRLTNVAPRIRNVFRYSGLDQVIEIS